MRSQYLLAAILYLLVNGSALSKCLPSEDPGIAECRYPAGDGWCKKKGHGNTYAYKDSCLTDTVSLPTAQTPTTNPRDVGRSAVEVADEPQFQLVPLRQVETSSPLAFLGEFMGRPLFDWGVLKFCLISAFVFMFFLTIIFAKVAEVGHSRTGELLYMSRIFFVGTIVMAIVFRVLLI